MANGSSPSNMPMPLRRPSDLNQAQAPIPPRRPSDLNQAQVPIPPRRPDDMQPASPPLPPRRDMLTATNDMYGAENTDIGQGNNPRLQQEVQLVRLQNMEAEISRQIEILLARRSEIMRAMEGFAGQFTPGAEQYFSDSRRRNEAYEANSFASGIDAAEGYELSPGNALPPDLDVIPASPEAYGERGIDAPTYYDQVPLTDDIESDFQRIKQLNARYGR